MSNYKISEYTNALLDCVKATGELHTKLYAALTDEYTEPQVISASMGDEAFKALDNAEQEILKLISESITEKVQSNEI